MESGFWELLTEKKATAGQNQGHRKSQDYLKLLTSIGKPQTAASHAWGALCLLSGATPRLISVFPHFFPHSSG